MMFGCCNSSLIQIFRGDPQWPLSQAGILLRMKFADRPFFEFMLNLKLITASILFQPCYRLSRYECVAAQRSDDKAGRERRQSSSRAFELSNRRALASTLREHQSLREISLQRRGRIPPQGSPPTEATRFGISLALFFVQLLSQPGQGDRQFNLDPITVQFRNDWQHDLPRESQTLPIRES